MTGTITVTAGTASQLVVTTAAARQRHRRERVRNRRQGRGRVRQRGSDLRRRRDPDADGQPQRCKPGRDRRRQRQRGAASFSGLTLDKAGTGVTIGASGTGLGSATTGTIIVTAAAATQLVVTTAPPGSVSAGNGFGLVVKAEDRNGNVDPTYTGAVTLALAVNPTGAALSGTVALNASAGVASFSGLTLNKAGAVVTLGASASGLSPVTTGTITVAAETATQLVVTTPPPGSVTAGSGFGLVVMAEDGFGNVDPTFTGAITLSLATNPNGATLGGTLAVNASAGVATFSGLTLNKAGTGATLQASGSGLSSATTGTLSITAATASQLVVTTAPPGSVTAGKGFGLVVNAEDPFGNIDTNFASSVTLSLATNPNGATLGGTLAVNASDGVATFSGLTLNKAAAVVTLGASASGLSPATTGAITVAAETATRLVVTAQPPTNVTAGTGFGLVVMAEDGFGNVDSTFTGSVSLTLANNPNGATLGGTVSVNSSAGVATFSGLTLDKAGTGTTLQASGAGLSSATTGAITVAAALATQLIVTTPPAGNVTAGDDFGLVVKAQDPFGNIDPSFGSSVTLALANNPNGATLGGTLAVNASAGVATFSELTLDKAGMGSSLLFSSPGLTGVTSVITVAPGTATQLVVTDPPPDSVTAGSGFGLTASAEDPFGNVDPNFTSSVTVTLANNPNGATLAGSFAVNASAGVASFSALTLNKAGTGASLLVSSPGLTGATTLIGVSPGSSTQLVVIAPPPASVSAGSGFAVTVAAEDGFGNVDTNFSSSVSLALGTNPNSATLGGTVTVNASAGVATFSDLTLDKTGAGATLRVSGTGLSSVTTGPIAVNAATASHLVVTAPPPAGVTAGNGFGLVVEAEDRFGNVDPGFTGSITVTVAANPNSATLGGTQSQSAGAGVATFAGLTLDKAGTGSSLLVSSSGLTAATTGAIQVNAGAATQLVVTTQPPSSVAAGDGFGLLVAAEDGFGNLDPSFTGTVTLNLAANPVGASLGGATTVTAGVGVATFSALTVDTAAGGYTFQASSNGLASATTGPVEVTPGAATQLVVTVQPPATLGAGAGFGLTVAAEDRFGELATGYTGTVTLALANNPGAAAIGGSVTVATVGGVATFAGLTLNKGGQGYTVQATSNGLSQATTNGIGVIAPSVSVTNVSVQSVHTGKKKTTSVIVVQFDNALIGAAAANTGAFYLTTAAQGKKHKSKTVPLSQASYDPVAHTVRLTTRDKLVLKSPVQLRINSSLLTNSTNSPVQATSAGQPGGELVATITKGGVSLD